MFWIWAQYLSVSYIVYGATCRKFNAAKKSLTHTDLIKEGLYVYRLTEDVNVGHLSPVHGIIGTNLTNHYSTKLFGK